MESDVYFIYYIFCDTTASQELPEKMLPIILTKLINMLY